MIAIACGIAAVPRGETRLGWWAIGIGIAGTLVAVWVQTKDADTVESIFTAGLFASMLRFATPLAFAAIGGVLSERAGVVNIGLEGMMLAGAFFGIWGAVWSGSWVVGLFMAMLFGGLLGLIHAVFSVTLRSDQIVSGFAINFLALGLTGFLFNSIYPQGIPSDVSRVPNVHLAFLDDVPFLGDVFGEPQPPGLDHVRSRHRGPRHALPDAPRPAPPLGRRAPESGRHGRYQRLRDPLRRRHRIRRAGRARRCLPLGRLRRLLRREHDRGARIHRARRGHLRQVAAGLGVRRHAALRLRLRPRGSRSSARRTCPRSSSRRCRTCSR